MVLGKALCDHACVDEASSVSLSLGDENDYQKVTRRTDEESLANPAVDDKSNEMTKGVNKKC